MTFRNLLKEDDKRLIFISVFLITTVTGQQQYFRVRPRNIEVGEGGIGIIPCEVGNRAGRVQWTRDGLTLGYDRSIPGIPRYEILGAENSGQFSLQITNVTLKDDAEFECQVGPANYNKPIRASSRLSVLLPPTAIEIVGRSPGSKIEIKENEEVELHCRVLNAKPKASIRWYRKGNLFESESETVSEEEGEDEEGEEESGRQTVTSIIQFRPTASDNGATFACEAEHPALINKAPMRVSVVLSVLFPSGPPEIEGYIQGETIRMGQTVSLVCVAHGGNPLAEVVWYRGNEQIDFSYYTTGRESRNMYTFVASSEDNNKRYRCKTKNSVSPEPMTADIVISVQFAPDKVTIEGPTEANVGDVLGLECVTSNSNPPAIVQWVVDSRSAPENFTYRSESDKGGWITRSNISVTIGPSDRNKIISCYAINNELGETIVETHTISVLYPPGEPSITGIEDGAVLDEGQIKRLTCISMAGNPLASLSWYRGDVPIPGSVQNENAEEKDFAQSELIIRANYSDNGVKYRCDASNPATAQGTGPLSTSIDLQVRYKPISITVKSDPEVPKAGKKAYLFCETGSSNPAANVSWRRNDNVEIGFPGEVRVRPGPYGGNITTNVLGIDVQARDHGATFVCEARNEALGESVNDGITLNVKYKPLFEIEPSETTFSVEEGESLLVEIEVRANPPEMTHKWFSPYNEIIPNVTDVDNLPRIFSYLNTINVTEARKEDAGKYRLKSTNSEGKSKLKIKIDVLYGPAISDITNAVVVESGDAAYFECTVDANPITPDTIRWSREDFDMEERTVTANDTNSMHLTVFNVSKEDSGEFWCTANNGIGDIEVQKSTFLLVRQPPRVDESPAISKAASDKRKTAILVCRAQGTPDVTFSWSRMGSVISEESYDDEDFDKYEIKYEAVDRMTWESELHVKNVSSRDYGSYDCIAQNEEGIDRHTVYLNVTSRPDTPTLLRVFNYTYNSVVLAWLPGFDGGYKQSFIIRYRKQGSETYQYTDVYPTSSNSFEVEDLKLGTKYNFAIKAFNDLGESDFTTDNVVVETLSYQEGMVKPEDKDVEGSISRGVILSITLLSGLLLILNVVLISCYVKRRRKLRSDGSVVEGESTVFSRSSSFEDVSDDDDDEIPILLITSVSVFGTLSVFALVLLVFIFRKRRISRKKNQENNKKSSSSTRSVEELSSGGEGGSSSGSTKSATIEMYAGSSYNDTMSGETLSSISEKSGSYASGSTGDPFHHHMHHHHHHAINQGGSNPHHRHHHHHHHNTLPSVGSHHSHQHHQRIASYPREDAEEESVLVDSNSHIHSRHSNTLGRDSSIVIGSASTYLVDNHHHHHQQPRSTSDHLNYVTMPRRPPRQPSSEQLRVPRESSADERGRRAYIQSLDPSKEDGTNDFLPHNPAASLDIESPIKKTYNGLYVPPADYEFSDSISLPPSSRESVFPFLTSRPHYGSMRHYSPETAGHLV